MPVFVLRLAHSWFRFLSFLILVGGSKPGVLLRFGGCQHGFLAANSHSGRLPPMPLGCVFTGISSRVLVYCWLVMPCCFPADSCCRVGADIKTCFIAQPRSAGFRLVLTWEPGAEEGRSTDKLGSVAVVDQEFHATAGAGLFPGECRFCSTRWKRRPFGLACVPAGLLMMASAPAAGDGETAANQAFHERGNIARRSSVPVAHWATTFAPAAINRKWFLASMLQRKCGGPSAWVMELPCWMKPGVLRAATSSVGNPRSQPSHARRPTGPVHGPSHEQHVKATLPAFDDPLVSAKERTVADRPSWSPGGRLRGDSTPGGGPVRPDALSTGQRLAHWRRNHFGGVKISSCLKPGRVWAGVLGSMQECQRVHETRSIQRNALLSHGRINLTVPAGMFNRSRRRRVGSPILSVPAPAAQPLPADTLRHSLRPRPRPTLEEALQAPVWRRSRERLHWWNICGAVAAPDASWSSAPTVLGSCCSPATVLRHGRLRRKSFRVQRTSET